MEQTEPRKRVQRGSAPLGRPPSGIITKLMRVWVGSESAVKAVDREHRARFLAAKAQAQQEARS